MKDVKKMVTVAGVVGFVLEGGQKMIITKLKQYSYPQKGIIEIVTELGTYTKFKGMVKMTKEGIKFYENGQEILATH